MGSNGKKTLVIRNGTLIDGSGSPAKENDAVVIEDNRIRSVGAIPGDLKLEDRENVEVIDATGQWVMPGLIDAHVHLSFGRPAFPEVASARGTACAEFTALRAAMNAQKALRAGATSISVPGGTRLVDVAVRDAVIAGLFEGPRIYCASRLINTSGEPGDRGVTCNGVEEMVAEVRSQCKSGVNYIKMIDSAWGEVQARSTEELSAVVEEAHRKNVRVAMHSRGSASTRSAAQAGVDWVMHADFATEADMDALAEAGVRIMPTFTSVDVAMRREGGFGGIVYNEEDVLKRSMEGMLINAHRARELGIGLLSGSDTGNANFMTYGDYHALEPELFVRDVGFSPMDAIVACTSGNAFAVGLEGEVGVIEAGKLADVIILKADPLADIRVLQDRKNLSEVIKDGHRVNRARLEGEESDLVFQLPAA